MSLKIAYISGPVVGNATRKNVVEITKKNFEKAKEYAHVIGNNFIKFFSPHLNNVEISGKDIDETQDFYYEQDTDFLIWMSGALVAIPGWEKSNGVKGEIEIAKILDIPIFYPQKASTDDPEIKRLIMWYNKKEENPEDYLERANKVKDKWSEILKIRTALEKVKVPHAA